MGLTTYAKLIRTPAQIAAGVLETFLTGYPKRDFQIRFWDGSTWGAQQPRFTLVLKHPDAARHLLLQANEVSLAEAYIFDDLDIEGDVEAAIDLGDYVLEHGNGSSGQNCRFPAALRRLTKQRTRAGRQSAALLGDVHSKERDRRAISYHYDLPPEFFALWLDRSMMYSSAYFVDEGMDLDAAQQLKLDYICRKLRLRRGDRLLDIGCGWGGLVIHAAAHYGVQAVGITLSLPQAETARRRIRDSGLDSRCRIEICDYRDLEVDQPFDKIASIGMFEHVGEAKLQEYFKRAWHLLQPGGAFLNSGIASGSADRCQEPSFIDRYVFPDGELVPLNIDLGAAERSCFEVRDVESLREHYALTLQHWVRRLEQHATEARRLIDEATYRVWRLYMAASAHRFRSGRLNLYHMLLVKPAEGRSGLPLTRADWYAHDFESCNK